MKYKLLIILLLFSYFTYSQCFNCSKNYGGWVDDKVNDLKKTNDGVSLLISGGSFNYYPRIIKNDFNCNELWKKTFNNLNVILKKHVYDNDGNLYLLLDYGSLLITTSVGPFYVDGITVYRGLNLLKLSSNGNIIWSKHVGDTNCEFVNIFNWNNNLYIIGAFYANINISGQANYSFPNSYYPRAFIAKYDYNGFLINSNYFGNGLEDYTSSEIDNLGNIYLSKYSKLNSNNLHSDIQKVNQNLQLVWSKEISNNNVQNSIYTPTNLFYNANNNKLYLWGAFNASVNILGNNFSVSGSNIIHQSLLTEFNPTNGDLTNIKRFDNTSYAPLPGVYGSSSGNTAYFEKKDDDLYIFTSFSGSMQFPNATINTSVSIPFNYKEDLLLFKVNVLNFDSEYILKSFSDIVQYSYTVDRAAPILFNNNDLYLTSYFQSKPILINNQIIDNNSGNNNSDVMLHKYSSSNETGTINVENTCFNGQTEFNLSGVFDNIEWNFGDPTSSNNVITGINNPNHIYSSNGNYHVVAVVTCGSNSQIIEKDIFITNTPVINSIPPIIECETISGSGICSEFNTTPLNNLLIGNQQNLIIEFRDLNGILLSSPLPNPYTNSNIGGDIIKARVFYSNNSNCYVESNINFITNPKPINPSLTSPQNFCIQQNATLNSIIIIGQNIKWYDALTNGNLLLNSTALTNGTTYYASQTINNCESTRVSVTVNIQDTAVPTGTNQSFCASQNATLNDIVVAGTNINWYSNNSSTTILPSSTLLVNGATYYATQTVNNCESVTKLPIIINLINTLNANNFEVEFCDDLNDRFELVNFYSYHSNLISNAANCTFIYYNSLIGATNQTASSQITSSIYTIEFGLNTIFVRITSSNGCHQIVELKLTLQPKPILTIKDIEPICENFSITIYGDLGYDDYTWSTGEKTTSIIINNPGDYSLTVIKEYATINCSTTKYFKVVKSNAATISEIITNDWTVNDNSITIVVTTSSVGDYEYSLDGIKYQSSNVFSGLNSGEYDVFIRDKNGCGIVKNEVYLLMYPKFFTPNGDGFNDTWKIKFINDETNGTTKIFDRFGKLLKQLNNNSDGWNGTFNGQELPSTDYWFTVMRADGKEHKGHFTLKR